MLSKKQLDRLKRNVRRHCREKGYQRSPWFNPMVPYDPVAACMMAKHLTQRVTFHHYIAVAPEGHVYGYFFEHFGAEVSAVFVDYPPRQFQEVDDLSVIRGQDALILEDDVISGTTLNLVVKGLEKYSPGSLSLYLGRPREAQYLNKVPSPIKKIYLAEDFLSSSCREEYESEFLNFLRDKKIF